MQEPVTMNTGRLILRQWKPEDVPVFADMNEDPEVMKYFPGPLSRQQSEGWAENCRQMLGKQGWGLWAVEVRASEDFIGFVGLHAPTIDLPFNPCVEIGWRLKRSAWGKGYATEAARECLRIGFEQLGLNEIVSFTSIVNTPSFAVMERLGMKRDPDSFQHPSVPPGHILREHCVYRLSRLDWMQSGTK
ncbi:MAG: GNAT family N-acetyltransferase [Pseudohongiella sp.]|nr:GNAT family N-acetyltransferase [Pseudohongiella sp.]MDO9518759.1 GNAT family N-acetyltransferase [Pseudohongiella sp.]MDP2126797.1 GNAT family N-acetyltransferase [Pseudohongiella sp.]